MANLIPKPQRKSCNPAASPVYNMASFLTFFNEKLSTPPTCLIWCIFGLNFLIKNSFVLLKYLLILWISSRCLLPLYRNICRFFVWHAFLSPGQRNLFSLGSENQSVYTLNMSYRLRHCRKFFLSLDHGTLAAVCNRNFLGSFTAFLFCLGFF